MMFMIALRSIVGAGNKFAVRQFPGKNDTHDPLG